MSPPWQELLSPLFRTLRTKSRKKPPQSTSQPVAAFAKTVWRRPGSRAFLLSQHTTSHPQSQTLSRTSGMEGKQRGTPATSSPSCHGKRLVFCPIPPATLSRLRARQAPPATLHPGEPRPGTKQREPAGCGLPCAGRRAPSRLAQATVRLAGLEVVLPEDSDVEAGVGAGLEISTSLSLRNPVGHDGNLQAELVGLAEQEVHAGGDGQA